MLLLNFQVRGQYLVSCNFLNSSSSTILSGATGLNLNYDVDMYKMTYNTVNTDSLPVIATGAFMVPKIQVATIFQLQYITTELL